MDQIDSLAEVRARIEADMRHIVSQEANPYDAAWQILTEVANCSVVGSKFLDTTYMIWGALTDWVESDPSETDQAYATICLAAREWLLLPNVPEAQEAYFRRWTSKPIEEMREHSSASSQSS